MRRHSIASVIALAAFAAAAAAQSGSLRGVVVDKDVNASLSGVTVQIVDTGQRVTTDDRGGFSFPDLKDGTYSVAALKPGYVRWFRSGVRITGGKLTDLRIEMLAEFTDLEEFIVEQALIESTESEQALLGVRGESLSMMDAVGNEQLGKANIGDGAEALRLVAGASVKDGESAVVRGLPDRYVASLVNRVLMPSADEDKRAVDLSIFPTGVIDSVQVSKTFTPDKQGNSSGGEVNVVLRSVPDRPFFVNWKTGTSYNSQVSGRGDFLTYEGGGVHAFGRSGSENVIQEEGENWDGAVGASVGEAPDNVNFSGSMGGKIEFENGWRIGGFANFFYKRNASFFQNGRDETRTIGQVGNLMSPTIVQGTVTQAPFFTSLLSVDQSQQEVQWGGLGTFGIENDDHALNLTYLFSTAATDTVTVAEDTQGKHFFFPGHDPDDPLSPGFADGDSAPYTRQQTLAYTERSTNALQLSGRHRWELYGFGPLRGVEFDWTVAKNKAIRDTPDRREFGTYWDPNAGSYFQLKPAAEFTLGNLQRTFIKIEEDSEELAANLRFPFETRRGLKGALKMGFFQDTVDRTFRQQTFSNFNDPVVGFAGRFDETRWSDVWGFEDHAITAGNTDVDYDGRQKIEATYLMLELPLTERLRLVGGVRFESTTIDIASRPEEDATWVPSVGPDGQPNFGILDFPVGPDDPDFDPALFALANPSRSQDDVLPALAAIYEIFDGVTLRGSYSETLARQTFKELSPIFQQEYIGGPVFIGDPNLQISQVQNFDARIDFTPTPQSLFSVSYFEKVIDQPIEYVEAAQGFTFTRPVNYPRGSLKGWEVEMRQGIGDWCEPLNGLTLGANSTWIDATVRRPDEEIGLFEDNQGVRPPTTRRMTDAPDYLWNAFITYDLPDYGSSLGVFYTRTGDTLLQGPGPSNNAFVPATYDRAYSNVSASFSQRISEGVTLTFGAKNLTNDEREQFYSTQFLVNDVTRRTYKTGVTWSLSIGGVITF